MPSDTPLLLRGPGFNVESKIVQTRNLITAGDLPGARAISDTILAQQPSHPGALIQRSRLESIEDHYRLAREYALSGYRAGVRNKRQCMFLLRRLKTFNLVSELYDFIPKLPPALLHDADVAKLVSVLLQAFNQPKLALHYLQLAEKHNPASASLQSEIGLALLNLGRLEEAEGHFLDALRISPDHAHAWWQLARLRKPDDATNHVDDLNRALARSSDGHGTALLAYSLHRELDRLGDYAKAADSLNLACASMKKVVPYSAEDDERLFAMLKSMPTLEAKPALGTTDAPFIPVFVVGMHRSGTTLLEQLLSGHHDICSGGELYDFTSQLRLSADHHCNTELDLQIIRASKEFDYDAIGQGYMNSVSWRRSGQRFVIDKLPSNFLNIGFILRALPHAKILHMSRDSMETCFSNLREPFSHTTCRYSYDQSELANYYRQYFSLMEHWRHRFPGRIHDVTYASLATDPAAELKRAAGFLGIEFEPKMLYPGLGSRSVNTASAVQVRQKPNLPLRPKWEPYRDHLTPLAWRLHEVGQRY